MPPRILTATGAAALLILSATASRAWARGEEQFGNDEISDVNYTGWPGIMPVINFEARIYRTWVNGNEHFYYRGDTAAANAALRKFAAIKADVREVVLRPGPLETRTFGGNRLPYDA